MRTEGIILSTVGGGSLTAHNGSRVENSRRLGVPGDHRLRAQEPEKLPEEGRGGPPMSEKKCDKRDAGALSGKIFSPTCGGGECLTGKGLAEDNFPTLQKEGDTGKSLIKGEGTIAREYQRNGGSAAEEVK